MVCRRFEVDGMRLLDGELTAKERAEYEDHARGCEDCRRELREIGRIVELTNQLKLRAPDEEFWGRYWDSLFHRMERGTGFFLLIAGVIAVSVFALYRAVTSPEFFTFQGIAIAVILLGVIVVFLSVVRERYHERKRDPYRGVEQ